MQAELIKFIWKVRGLDKHQKKRLPPPPRTPQFKSQGKVWSLGSMHGAAPSTDSGRGLETEPVNIGRTTLGKSRDQG